MAEPEKIINKNRKAFHDYEIMEKLECGMVLQGTEIKSLRSQGCELKESYVRFKNGEAWLYQLEIPLYKYGTYDNHDPFRVRKLLMHKRQIKLWQADVDRKGLTVIPLSIYIKSGRAKLKIALCRGKKHYDKRQDIKKKDANREIARAVKSHNYRK